MCGRFSLGVPTEALQEQFQLFGGPVVVPRYNIAPTQPVAAVRMAAGGERELVMLRWGLIPSWAKDMAMGARMINARAETVAEKPSFRSALKSRRCLIAADGFYEWRKEENGKQPYFIRLRGGVPFAFAGLWETWKGPEGPIESCPVITTEANEMMRELHHRMPVILPPEDYSQWLKPDETDREVLLGLLRPFASGELEALRVSTHVNSPAHDDPQCIAPVA